MTPPARIRRLNDAPVSPDGAYVLYWMVASRRLGWNHALDRAIEYAADLARPLIVFEALAVDYPWASDRHHLAILDGMAEHREALQGSPVTYYPYVEPHAGAGRGLLAALLGKACVLVVDDAPTFFTPRLLEAASRFATVRAEAVDSCGLLPVRDAGRTFSAAYHFRRHFQKVLLDHLGDVPDQDPLTTASALPAGDVPQAILERWPAAPLELVGPRRDERIAAVGQLPIDHSVGPTGWTGGHRAARARLDAFLDDGLSRYGTERNDPDSGASSGLSPWLHYGHVSAHEIFRAVADREAWTPNRIDPPPNGRRAGWWGMSESAEAFLDQLVVWRELGFGFCVHEPSYARYESLPAWAVATLDAHASDPREWTYTLDEFASASTHDEIWNAAQRQLVEEGVIHNYLRMLWGKKILEWTSDPRQALDVMVELNNRYALDGRDPNSWTGIMWVLGRFDRGWPERPIYGTVRSMSSDSTRRKVDLDEYLARWNGQRRLF